MPRILPEDLADPASVPCLHCLDKSPPILEYQVEPWSSLPENEKQ